MVFIALRLARSETGSRRQSESDLRSSRASNLCINSDEPALASVASKRAPRAHSDQQCSHAAGQQRHGPRDRELARGFDSRRVRLEITAVVIKMHLAICTFFQVNRFTL